MIWILYLLCAAAAGYQITALAAVLRQLLRRDPVNSFRPSVSILKPVKGRDSWFDLAIASHIGLEYPPGYQLLFGVHDADDPAANAVRALPGASLLVGSRRTPNQKVGLLMDLAARASGDVLVVNDGDIRVTPDYLLRVVAPLANPAVGLVTCLYRPVPFGAAAAWEALGIATDFAPSTLVAPLVGIDEFGLGSTLCFRAADLQRIGGFETVAGYIADDYQLAARLTRGLGKRAWMSRYVVSTGLEYTSWKAMWKHQVRWARTIRRSRPEYLGLPVTHAGLWALVILCCGPWTLAAALAGLRMLTGFTAGVCLLRCPAAWALPLIPLWDLFAFAVWVAGIGGETVEWRGSVLRLTRDGRIG